MMLTTTAQALMSASHLNREQVVNHGEFRFPSVGWTDMASDKEEKQPVWGDGVCDVCFTVRSCNGSCSCSC